jgi:hypothetical protein
MALTLSCKTDSGDCISQMLAIGQDCGYDTRLLLTRLVPVRSIRPSFYIEHLGNHHRS